MNSTRIWMKLMGFHNFYTGKYSNYSLIGKWVYSYGIYQKFTDFLE